jgi:hypothetical protein
MRVRESQSLAASCTDFVRAFSLSSGGLEGLYCIPDHERDSQVIYSVQGLRRDVVVPVCGWSGSGDWHTGSFLLPLSFVSTVMTHAIKPTYYFRKFVYL